MSAVCWHEDGRLREGHWHPDRTLIIYGRCRSGRRWFWAANTWSYTGDGDPKERAEHGWQDSEQQALAGARAAVERLAGGHPAVAYPSHGYASDKLKRVNAERRRARPAPDTSDAGRVEYLHGRSSCGYDGQCPCEELRGQQRWDYHAVRYRITKKTPKRIYYIRHEHGHDGPEIGYIDRQKLEADGEASPRLHNWWAADSTLYLRPPQRLAEPDPTPADVARLRAEAANAHPDRGGTNEAFREAHGRYLAAKARAGS